MSVKKTMFISGLSDLPGSERYATSRSYDSMQYVKKSINYFIIGSIIGLLFGLIVTSQEMVIDPGMSITMTRLVTVLMFGYIGFSFHAGISLFNPDVSFFTIILLTITGLIALVIAFASAIGCIIAIPRFIINVRRIFN